MNIIIWVIIAVEWSNDQKMPKKWALFDVGPFVLLLQQQIN